MAKTYSLGQVVLEMTEIGTEGLPVMVTETYKDGETKLTYDRETFVIEIDQKSGPVHEAIIKENCVFVADLPYDLELASKIDVGVTKTGEEYSFGSVGKALKRFSIGIKQKNGTVTIFTIPNGSVKLDYDMTCKADGKAIMKLTVTAVGDENGVCLKAKA